MRFGFTIRVVGNAQDRQYDGGGRGFQCAVCGGYQHGAEDVGWFAIPRIPIQQGRKISDNCVIVCAKCAKTLGQDGTKTIPFSELPFYRVSKRRF